jgi:anthranilate phosphoribosyltransferase
MKKQDAIYLGNLVRSTVACKQLDKADAERAFTLILEDNTPLADFYWGSLCSAVQVRGPKKHEIEGFLEAAAKFDKKICLNHGQKMPISTDKPVVAITGSGKDTWKTFNVSTTASFIAASCGACVVKPGSSATSSMTGAVQVLDFLGMP